MINNAQIRFKPLSLDDDLDQFLKICRETYLETYSSGTQPEFCLEDIEETLFGEAYLAKLQTELNFSQVEYILVLVNDELAGYAKLIEEAGGEIELDKLYFLKQYHGRGYGRQLFKKCCERVKARGKNSIYWHVNVKNTKAIQFYKKLGGKIIGTADLFFIDHYNPNYVMEVKITEVPSK